MKKAKGLAVRAAAAALACALIAGFGACGDKLRAAMEHPTLAPWVTFIAGNILVPVDSPDDLANVPGFPFRLIMAASVEYYHGWSEGDYETYFDGGGSRHILLTLGQVRFIAEACFGIDYMTDELLRELAVNNGYPLRDGYGGECIDTTVSFEYLGSPDILSGAVENGQIAVETKTDIAPYGEQIPEYVYMRYTFAVRYSGARPVYMLTRAEVREAPPDAADPYYVAPPSVSAPASPRGTFSINGPLLALVGQPLSGFERDPAEEYTYRNIGSGRDTVEFYNPYICFNINSIVSGKDGTYPDPLVSERALVQSFYLGDKPGAGDSQSSLKRLFITDEVITYALLCEELLQTPQLAHYPNSGAYEAVFELSGTPVTVNFDSGYAAVAAEVGSGEYVM